MLALRQHKSEEIIDAAVKTVILSGYKSKAVILSGYKSKAVQRLLLVTPLFLGTIRNYHTNSTSSDQAPESPKKKR